MWWKFSKEVMNQAGEYKVARVSASVSYYTIFALAPTLFIFVALSSLVLGVDGAIIWLANC